LYGVDAITRQFVVAIAFDSMILIIIFGIQLNVGGWAAVRQQGNSGSRPGSSRKYILLKDPASV
jgi:hypothetical protein